MLIQQDATYSALKDLYIDKVMSQQLPFIISRANAFGSGKYAAHYLADIPNSWEFLENAVAWALDMNLFGIPFVGVELDCVKYDFSDGLCSRWIQLATMLPLLKTVDTTFLSPDNINQQQLI